jgi:HEAT repeat protein
MRAVPSKLAWAVTAICVLLLSLKASADLDVGIPAGSPIEWIDNIPSVAPDSYRGSIPKKASDRGETTVMPAQAKVPPANSVFSYVKVITWDLPTHLRWYGEEPRAPESKDIPTGNSVKIQIRYPPTLPNDLFWLASVGFIRKSIHPAELNDAETVQYLIFLGEASLAAAEAAKSQPSMADYVKEVTDAVSAVPDEPPSFDKSRNDYENMMIRLTFEDLATEYPFSLNQRFAARIAQLGDEPVPYVIRAAGSRHTFLLRNAVHALGRYGSKEAVDTLRNLYLANKDKDKVVRNRALEALARKRDAGIVDDLVKRLRGGDRYFRPYAAWALGMIGDPAAVPHLHNLLKASENLADPASFDAATSAIIALGRLRCGGDDKIVAYLDRLRSAYASRSIEDPQPALRPDLPVPPNTRRDTAVQLLAIALAGSRPDKHARELYALIEASKSAPDPDTPSPYFKARYARGMLRSFKPMTVNFLIDTLPICPEGKTYLRQIALDPKEDETVRALALFRLAASTYDKLDDLYGELVDFDKQPAVIVEVALQALVRSNRKMAGEAAKALVTKYLAGLAPRTPQAPGGVPVPAPAVSVSEQHKKYVIAVAIKALGTLGGNDAGQLISLLQREAPVRMQERARREAPPPPPAPRPAGVAGGLAQTEFSSPNGLLEHILIELGRTGDAKALTALLDHLRLERNDARAEACLAIGAFPADKRAAEALVKALEDGEGWVRYMAYRTLKQFSAHDFFCDWIYASEQDRAFPLMQWQEWLRSR